MTYPEEKHRTCIQGLLLGLLVHIGANSDNQLVIMRRGDVGLAEIEIVRGEMGGVVIGPIAPFLSYQIPSTLPDQQLESTRGKNKTHHLIRRRHRPLWPRALSVRSPPPSWIYSTDHPMD